MKIFIDLLVRLSLLVFLFFNVFVSNTTSRLLTIVVLIAFLILSIILHKFRGPTGKNQEETLIIIFGICVSTITLLYVIGFFSGYSTNYSVIYRKYIKTSIWLSIFIMLFVTELIRYIQMQVKVTKRTKNAYVILDAIMIGSFVLVDLACATKTYNFNNFNQLYEFFALILVQSVSKNLLLNFVSKRTSFIPCLVYRLVMDLYIYFVPIVPKVNMFIEAVILLIVPYIIYVAIVKFNDRKIIEPAKKRKKKGSKLLNFASIIIFALLVCLVSREFRYCMIGIGSGSMTGAINKGDAIIYEKYDNIDLQVGDVIVFYKNNKTIVHRIETKYELDDEVLFKTKGDANTSTDNWTVEERDIIGVVRARIMLIAWPSVLINELF